jgi:quinoprotein glucose dehydrogenase
VAPERPPPNHHERSTTGADHGVERSKEAGVITKREERTVVGGTGRRRAGIVLVALGAATTLGVGALYATVAATDRGPVAGAVEWAAYGRDALGSRYAPVAEVTRENVDRLRVAWTYRTGEMRPEFATKRYTSFEATPLVVDGVMYLSTPLGRVIALDPESGRERWVFDPKIDRRVEYGDFANRGVSTWLDSAAAPGAPCRRRILVATIDARLIALDAATGSPCVDFGGRGTVGLRGGLRNPPRSADEYEQTSPPAVVNGLVVVGSAVADNNRIDAPSGEVRAYDARTGALRWTWDPVPQDPADPAYGTWEGPQARRTGAANAWSVIAADPERDLVIVPTGSASPDYYGGERLGDNRYANSVVALRASTGKLVWHFQTVHHDVWDYDNASPPALVTVRKDGREVPAVLQATKTGQLFVLHRETGEPLFPVTERPVPRSTVPGEVASPTQPFSAVAPLSPHQLRAEDAWGVSAEEREACRAMIAGLRNEGIFTPPSLEGTLVLPSNVGGAHWGGLAYDPERRIAVVPVNRVAAEVQLIPADKLDRTHVERAISRLGYQYTRMHGTPYVMRRRILRSPLGLPCTPPPFGTLVAVSLETGAKLWEVPLGSLQSLAPKELQDRMRPEWGSVNLGGPVITAGGLVITAGTLDRAIRAFDVETGKELWKGELPASGKATPMTYRVREGGRQYVVVAAGGGDVFGAGDYLVAFALPATGGGAVRER